MQDSTLIIATKIMSSTFTWTANKWNVVFKDADHVDDRSILRNDCTTQHLLLIHTFCICFSSRTWFHILWSSNALRQNLSSVAILDKYRTWDIVYNVLFSHRIHVCPPTLSKCTTKQISAAHLQTKSTTFFAMFASFNLCENNIILIFAMHCKISESDHIPWLRHDKICSSSLQQHVFCHHLQLLVSQKKWKIVLFSWGRLLHSLQTLRCS